MVSRTCVSAHLLRFVLVSLASLSIFTGCSVESRQAISPVANFGGAFTAVAGTQQQFNAGASTDLQGGPLTYAWNFGDGVSATGVSPAHTYTMVGAVVVSLTVTNTGGLSSIVTATGTISPGTPAPNPGGPYTGTVATPLTFTAAASTDPQSETLTYAWTFGDGTTAAGATPVHTYATPGTYPVSLTVTDTSDQSATATGSATIAALPPMANAGGPYTGVAASPLTFSAGASTDPQHESLTYAWNFGDNTTAAGIAPTHTYLTPGGYTVSLTTTNTSNLSATATTTATVAAAPPPSEDRVMAGRQPISNSSVQLYAVGIGAGSASTPLLSAPVVTDQTGGFSIAGLYTCPSPATQVYLAATGGDPGVAPGANNPSISLLAALGSCAGLSASSAFVTVNEISTVVAIWSAATYIPSISQIGTADPRLLSNAFIDSVSLASIVAGSPTYPGIAIPNQDAAIRSLANALNTCVASDGRTAAGSPCASLFAAATPTGGSAPADTASAALAIALNPAANVAAIYNLAASNPTFQPALTASPADWTLSLPQPPPTIFSSTLNATTVFMGDSITQWWPLPINNQGIAGQHASQMLARFSTDVLGHGYTRVVILAGTNDLWLPIAGSDQALQQIETMAQTARAAGIEVVLCELPPMLSNPAWYSTIIVPFNAALAQFAMANGYLLVDYYTPMASHPEYFIDGVHPNTAGYAVMEAALSSVIQQ